MDYNGPWEKAKSVLMADVMVLRKNYPKKEARCAEV